MRTKHEQRLRKWAAEHHEREARRQLDEWETQKKHEASKQLYYSQNTRRSDGFMCALLTSLVVFGVFCLLLYIYSLCT